MLSLLLFISHLGFWLEACYYLWNHIVVLLAL